MIGEAPFASRLRDLLATLEASALLGVAAGRVRGLGEQLRFACLATPCDEALVALELESFGRLRVPVVADADEARAVEHDFLPTGTAFAYLLGGGSGHAAALAPDDPMIAPLAPLLRTTPASAVFVPIRIGDAIAGGAALFSNGSLGDRELVMAERLAEVLALTVESFRTERALFELFALALPDLLREGAPTSLREALENHIRSIRAAPAHRRSLAIAAACARLASLGENEAKLAADIIDRVEAYARGVAGGFQ